MQAIAGLEAKNDVPSFVVNLHVRGALAKGRRPALLLFRFGVLISSAVRISQKQSSGKWLLPGNALEISLMRSTRRDSRLLTGMECAFFRAAQPLPRSAILPNFRETSALQLFNLSMNNARALPAIFSSPAARDLFDNSGKGNRRSWPRPGQVAISNEVRNDI